MLSSYAKYIVHLVHLRMKDRLLIELSVQHLLLVVVVPLKEMLTLFCSEGSFLNLLMFSHRLLEIMVEGALVT